MLDGSGQTVEEKELANKVRSEIEEIRGAPGRIAQEGIWMTNIAYVKGLDGIYFNSQTRSFQNIDRAGVGLKRNRMHVNKILPTVQNRLARLCKNAPKYDVKPETSGTDDKEAARLALQILQSLWDKLTLNEKRLALYMWVQQAGHCYMKVNWDPTEGECVADPDMPGQMVYAGEVRAEIVTPFEVFPHRAARNFNDVLRTGLIQAKVRTLDYFRMEYEKGHLVKEEDAWLLSASYESRINNMNSRGPSGGMEMQKNSAIELIKYEARCPKYPNGRMVVSANGILLENKELPLGEIPFAKFDDIITGSYYPESVVTHLRPIQDQYNELVRRRAAWVRKFVAGKYKCPKGIGLSEEALDNSESEVAFYEPSPTGAHHGPEALTVPTLPQWAFMEEDRYTAQFNDISGISEVSRGTLPSASIPAIGMELLVEQDDSRIGVMTEQHEHAWARVGKLILKTVEANYKMPRKLKIAGPNLEYAVKDVTGDMLKGNTDVTVVRGSTQPGSTTVKKNNVMNLYTAGLLGDQADPKVREKVLALMEFGDVQDVWQDYGLDMAQIKKGIEKIQAGQIIEVNEFDNHALWLQELNRFRKGDKFSELPMEMQGLVIELMEQHIAEVMKLKGAPTPADLPLGPEVTPGQAMAELGPPPPAEAPLVEAEGTA